MEQPDGVVIVKWIHEQLDWIATLDEKQRENLAFKIWSELRRKERYAVYD